MNKPVGVTRDNVNRNSGFTSSFNNWAWRDTGMHRASIESELLRKSKNFRTNKEKEEIEKIETR